MPPLIPNSWTTEQEYIELLNFLIERTENVESPMCIKRLAREFKEKSGVALTAKCIQQRIGRVRKIIHSFEHIDTKTKVKLMFALSASVNADFLKELKKDASVEVDHEKRIKHYKANEGSLEFRGDHSHSAKMKTGKLESMRSYRSLITSYFEKNDKAVPTNDGVGEMWNLIEFITEKCDNVDTPLRISRLAEDFVGKFRTSMPPVSVISRINGYGLEIQRMEFVDTRSKVKQLFALSATVNSDCLEKLRKDALIEVDEKNRIVFYKANDGSIELRGDHSQSAKISIAKQESKQSFRSLMNSYFEKKNDADAVPDTEEEKEMWNLIEFITEKCETTDSPLNISQLTRDFIEHFGYTIHTAAIRKRIKSYCREIQEAEFLDTSVKQLFGLSATVNSDYLEKLRKDAHVEVDEKNRISYYKMKNGDLELRGDHSQSAKTRAGKLESKRSFRSLINSYFEKKNDADAIPENKENKEMGNLIEFITEKCVKIDKPLSIFRLAADFKTRFGISTPLETIYARVKGYCREIQKTEFLNTKTIVQQLFGLSAEVNLDYLKILREDALVEVDNLNRITKYTANNGSLTLIGDHSQSAKRKLGWIVRRKNNKSVKKNPNSDGDKSEESERENEYSGDDSDEYSSEEFGSEFDSDDENDHLEKTEEITVPSKGAVDNDNENPVRNYSPTEIPIDDNFDFDPPTERTFRPEETALGENEEKENDSEIMGNKSVKTRHGRLFKRRHLDSALSNNQVVNSSSSRTSINTESASSKHAKQKKMKIDNEVASISPNQSGRSSRSMRRSARSSSFSTFSTETEKNKENHDAPRAEENPSNCHKSGIQKIEDYDYNPREGNIPKSSPVDNRIQESEPSAAKDHNPSIEAQNTDNRADAVAPEPEPEPVEETLTPQNNKNSNPPTNGEEVTSQETPIEVEHEEPILAEHPTEDVKPETAHNSKMKFFEAMKSLILFLDTPSLSNLQSKIHQKILKMKGSKEVLQNNELIPALELLVARMANHSVIDISKAVKSVSLIQFFCYLKASILNSKINGVDGLMNNIGELIEKSQNKRIPMEKVSKALRATLDVDGF